MDAEEDLWIRLERALAEGVPLRDLGRELFVEVSRRAYREVVDGLPVAVIGLDLQGRIDAVNPTALALLGYSGPEELVGHSAFELLPAEDAGALRDRIADRVGGAAGEHREYKVRRADGSLISLLGHADLVTERGRPVGMRVVAGDLTPLRTAEARSRELQDRILQAQKLESLGVLAGGIAHEFNNLLVAVLGHSELVLADLPDGAPVRDDLERIRQSALRGAELCAQLVAYAGKSHLTLELVHLADLVRNMATLIQVSVGPRATLRLDLAPVDPVRGDPAQLRQVVMNLVGNAAEALGETGGTVRVSVSSAEVDERYRISVLHGEDMPLGPYTVLEVSDTGVGMDGPTLERIFEPFFTTKFAGRGLGLAAVQGIVHAHHGRLRVYSEVGRGSTLKVLLPSIRGAEIAPTPAVADPSGLGGGLVLVVDDEPTVAGVARTMLERLGFEVAVAGDGVEALRWFVENGDRVRLVLLDLTMPRMDGRRLFQELRRVRPDVRVLMCSGYDEEETTSGLNGKGAGFLQKPYTWRALTDAVRRSLSG